MDKGVVAKAVNVRVKPPILPKPKVIPERPRVASYKTPKDGSPVALTFSTAQTGNVNGSEYIHQSSASSIDLPVVENSQIFVENVITGELGTSDALGTISDLDIVSDTSVLERESPRDVCEDNAISLESDFREVSQELHSPNSWINDSISEDGEKDDHDDHSLASEKFLDISYSNCHSSSNVETSLGSIDSSETCSDYYSDNNNFKSNDRAFLIAKEFMTSEQIYVRALRLIVIDFKQYLNTSYNYGPVISASEFDKIVSTLPQLLKLNEDLLADLEERISTWSSSPKIADVIVKKGPFLKLYSTYMKNFETHCSAVDELCVRYPKFSQALHNFEQSDICKKLGLKHYMLKPIQRIPQYRLLLEKYLSALEVDSEEFNNANIALKIVQDVLHHANSTIKLTDNLYKLLNLQSRLGNYVIIKPGRSFIKEGELQKLSRKEIQPRFFILLSDCLLYTTYSTSSGHLRMKYELPLSGMRVNLHEDTEFDIITSTRSFTLRARDDDECFDWVNSLHLAISDHNQRQRSFINVPNMMVKSMNSDSLRLGKVAPVWIPDNRATMCQLCTAEFTVTFRRHHCRCCGRVICSNCSMHKAPLQYLKFETDRVCDECYDYLFKEFEDPDCKIIECIISELGLDVSEATNQFQNLKLAFKKVESAKKAPRIRKRLMEVPACDSDSQISGWLELKGKRGWKRLWFVLKDQVLYSYKASHDVMARRSLPVLGYTVEPLLEADDDVDKNVVFQVTHHGQPPLILQAPSEQAAKMWVSALTNATVLK